VSKFNESDDAINIPFQKVFMDILGPLDTSSAYHTHYVVTLVDVTQDLLFVNRLF